MLQNGILHQTSCANTLSQNVVAKRKNKHLFETIRDLLYSKLFWADTMPTFYFLTNRITSSVLSGKTPYHNLFRNKSLFPIDPKIFCCVCFVQDIRPCVTKLDPKSFKCIFLQYSRVQKGYRCYCHLSYIFICFL